MIGGRLYAFLRALVRVFFALFYPIRAKGTAYFPQEGPVLLCANHESLADPVAIICALNRPVRFMAKKRSDGRARIGLAAALLGRLWGGPG